MDWTIPGTTTKVVLDNNGGGVEYNGMEYNVAPDGSFSIKESSKSSVTVDETQIAGLQNIALSLIPAYKVASGTTAAKYLTEIQNIAKLLEYYSTFSPNAATALNLVKAYATTFNVSLIPSAVLIEPTYGGNLKIQPGIISKLTYIGGASSDSSGGSGSSSSSSSDSSSDSSSSSSSTPTVVMPTGMGTGTKVAIASVVAFIAAVVIAKVL